MLSGNNKGHNIDASAHQNRIDQNLLSSNKSFALAEMSASSRFGTDRTCGLFFKCTRARKLQSPRTRVDKEIARVYNKQDKQWLRLYTLYSVNVCL